MPSPIAERSRLYVTPYFEYVVYESVCLSVRERETGEWLERHYALGQEVELVLDPSRPDRAPDLLIHASFTQVQIGPVLSVERPNGEVVKHLTSKVPPIAEAS